VGLQGHEAVTRKVTDVTFTGNIKGLEVIPLPHARTELGHAGPRFAKHSDRQFGSAYTTRVDVSGGAFAAGGGL